MAPIPSDNNAPSGGKVEFEVQVDTGVQWLTKSKTDNENEAQRAAEGHLGDNGVRGVRVMRIERTPKGKFHETEVFAKLPQAAKDGVISITHINETVPLCTEIDDFYTMDSRRVISRVFRNYLELKNLTAIELLCDAKEIDRLQNEGGFLISAINHIGSLQARQNNLPSDERKGALLDAVDNIRARAAAAAGRFPLADNLGLVLDRTEGPPDEVEFNALVALAKETLGRRSWGGKLERLCGLAKVEETDRGMAMIDAALADVLETPVIEQLLGFQRHLGEALCALFDLAQGKFDINRSEIKEIAETLNNLLGENKLPHCRKTIVNRAHRQLASGNPLNRREPENDADEFKKIAARAFLTSGLIDGTNTAEALTTRFTRMVEVGGYAGERDAILWTHSAMPDEASGMVYLCDLIHSRYGEDHMDSIIERFLISKNFKDIDDICRFDIPPKQRMIRATRAFNAVKAAGLPDDLKANVLDTLDTILEDYIVAEEIVERIDNEERSLRDRSVMLVQFCGSGVLPEGKALARARARVQDILRQPDFDVHLVEGITDPARAQETLRSFHRLLVKSGFA